MSVWLATEFVVKTDQPKKSTGWHILAHLSKSNSRTFQGLSMTTRRIYDENNQNGCSMFTEKI